MLQDVIVKSAIPISQNHTLEILLMDTHEDYTRGVTNVFESPTFEDAALLEQSDLSEADVQLVDVDIDEVAISSVHGHPQAFSIAARLSW